MRRFLIGCLAVFALLFVGGGVVAYMFLWRPAQHMVQTVREFQRVGELNDRVRNDGPFRPPADSLMTDDQLRRYVDVQRGMRAALEEDYRVLRARVEAIDTAPTPSPRDLLNAYRDVAALVLEAKRAQVAELNEQNFSLDEYEWVRRQTVAALGHAVFASFDLPELIRAARQGEDPVEPMQVDVPAANGELVDRYRDELEELIGFALVGL